MCDEIKEIQQERAKIYGNYKINCKKVGLLLQKDPLEVANFYIAIKIVRWKTYPKPENRDSLIDLLSYIDLTQQHFKDELYEVDEIKFNTLKEQYQAILKELDESESAKT